MTDLFLSYAAISLSVGLLVLVLILLAPFLNRRYAAKWKYFIWIFLAVRLVVPLGGGNGQLIADALSQTKGQAGAENEETLAAAAYRPIMVELPEQMITPIPVQNALRSGEEDLEITILDIVIFVWLAGCLIFAAVHLISYFHYKRQVTTAGRLIEDIDLFRQVSELKRELHISRSIRVIEYREAGSPMIMGFLKPVLVLPEEQYSPVELCFILKHELVHFKRGDVYLKLLFVTANAVHWFNPLIWILQREAVVDMELSCDERVTRGAGLAERKAYTEALLSTLHKRCARKNGLSTQFYGGKRIMKMRFQNILKNGKKNGSFLLVCSIALTICLGMLVGCSITKADPPNADAPDVDISYVDAEDQDNQSELGDVQVEDLPVSADGSFVDASSTDNALKNTMMLTFSKEGEEEQKQATLAVGSGYSVYLPDGEWQQSDADMWTASVNDQVRLWIIHYENGSIESVDKELAGEGYVMMEDSDRQKQEDDLIVHAELKEDGNDVWGIFYRYPAEAEEGWGRELPVIVDTFAVSVGTDPVENISSDNAEGYLQAADCEEIRGIVDEFAQAYFDGNTDTVRKFLAGTYEGTVDLYEGSGVVSDLNVKGLSDADEKRIVDGSYVASVEFRDSSYEDMLLYLTIVLRREDGWKIQFYGVEG